MITWLFSVIHPCLTIQKMSPALSEGSYYVFSFRNQSLILPVMQSLKYFLFSFSLQENISCINLKHSEAEDYMKVFYDKANFLIEIDLFRISIYSHASFDNSDFQSSIFNLCFSLNCSFESLVFMHCCQNL